MHTKQTKPTSRERGFSLVEVLVAVAIFAIIFIAALMLYDRGTATFKRGVEAADTQQNTRVAFDKIVSDVRMAGFDYDRDGFPSGTVGSVWKTAIPYGIGVFVVPTTYNNFYYRATVAGTSGGTEPAWPTTAGQTVTDGSVTWEAIAAAGSFQQPDEQVEYAGPAAITIRGNLDYEIESGQENGRETVYQSIQFPLITTGNDEIVTYALRSNTAAKGTAPNNQSVTFFADVNNGGAPSRTAYPGGSAERLVTIPGFDLSNNNPPYTLYRITLDAAGSPVESPLAENIRSLQFLYYQDQQGVAPLEDLTPVARPDGATILGLGQYDPNNPSVTVAGRAVRSRIRSVRVMLVGMNSSRDGSYQDETETLASARNFRKYRLESLIVPRNIGKRGLREQDTTPPGAPVLTKLWLGHCCLAKVDWTPPVTGGAPEGYAVLYDIDLIGGFANVMTFGQQTTAYIPFLPTQVNQTWYFAVQATSSFGNGPESNNLSGTPLNETQPEPLTVITTNYPENGVQLIWQRPADNVDPTDLDGVPSGTLDEGIPSSEIIRYRVFRSIGDPTFAPANTTAAAMWDEGDTGSALGENPGTGLVTFTDPLAANCVDYYYRVSVTDRCSDAVGTPNEPGATGLSDLFPALVDDGIHAINPGTGALAPVAPGQPNLGVASACSLGTCTVILRWPEVTQDTDTPQNAIVVDRYDIVVRRKLAGTFVDYWSGSPVTVSGMSAPGFGPVIQHTLSLPEPDGLIFDTYEFSVVAWNCALPSAESPTVLFPCVFSGALSPAFAIPQSIDGDGSGTPFLVFGTGSLNISGLGPNVTTVNITVFAPGPVEVIPATDYPVVGGVVSGIPLIDPPDDASIFVIQVTATDTGGCKKTYPPVTFQGTSTNCCLRLVSLRDGADTALGVGDPTLRVNFTNQCASTVTLDTTGGLRFNWRGSNYPGGRKLNAINWQGTAGVVANFNEDILVSHDRPAGAQSTIAGGANYFITFTNQKNLSSVVEVNAPVKDFCISYNSGTVCTIIDDGAAPNCP